MPEQIDYTMRYKLLSGKTQYANLVVQQELINRGQKLSYTIASPDKDASATAFIRDAYTVTTPQEVATYLSEIAIPSSTPTDPYLSDKLYQSLTTSASLYKSATVGSWVPITPAEYTALQTNILNTTLAGTTASVFSGTFSGAYTLGDFVTTNGVGANSPAIPANSYVYAVAVFVRTVPTTPMTDVILYTNNNTTTPTSYNNFIQYGPKLPTLNGGRNYFILKGVNQVSASNDGVLAISAPGGATTGTSQSYNIVFNNTSGGVTMYSRYGAGVLPVTTSLELNGSYAAANGIQALTTPTVQWSLS